MKNKIFIFIILLAIILIIITAGLYYYKFNKKELVEEEIDVTETEILEPIFDVTNSMEFKNENNQDMTKDDIKIENLKLDMNESDARAKVTLRNTSKETLDGVDVTIYLLDENDVLVTAISSGYKDKIKPNTTFEIENFLAEIQGLENIKKVKLDSVESGNIKDTMQNMMEQTEEELNIPN